MDTESVFNAIAAVLKPKAFKVSMEASGQEFLGRMVHGIWNTVPMLTREARRYNGSAQPWVRSTASMPRAAAERIMAPTLVGFTTSSRIEMRFACLHTSSTEGRTLRFMAQSMPRVSAKPVSFVSTLYSAVNTGTSGYFSRSCLVSPASAATSRFSARKEIGAYPAFNARSITLGLSAINTPGAGSK